jgi:hypothetical protein
MHFIHFAHLSFFLFLFYVQCLNVYINFFTEIYVRLLNRMILRNLIPLSMNKSLDHLNISANLSQEQEDLYIITPCFICRSKWPRGLSRGCAAARLLRVRILRGGGGGGGGGCLSLVSVLCCQVVSATSLSLVQRSPNDCGSSMCVI